MNVTLLAVMLLVAIAAATLAYGLMYSRIEVEKKTQSRVKRVRTSDNERDRVKAAQDRVQELSKRRKSLQDSLKELEDKKKSKRVKNRTMKARLEQSGLSIDLRRFYLYSGGFALFVALLALLADVPLFGVLGIAFAIGLGLPRWTVGFLISRRQNKFLEEFPNALDVMVRSIRSGLPLNDAMRLIASDGPEPVKTEFRRVIESQQVGMSIPDACARMVNTMPLPEVNFFAIVIAIQSQAGGNLSEALSNLAKVLRDRRKMKAKVKALSMEAKASAVIIGSLPFVVSLLVYLTSPAYIEVLFVDLRGHFILLFSGIWMSIGIVVMRQMINFDI